MTAISRLSISSRIGLLCLIPLVGLLYFGVSRLVHDLQKVQEENRIAGIIENAPVISALVHQLQKERGTSAGFIGAQGAQFRDDLRSRRAETDEALEAFRTTLPEVSGVLAEPTFAEPFKRANEYLDDLAEKRSLVGGMRLSVGEMAKYYTGTIVELLNMVEAVSLLTDDAHLVRDGLAYSAILQGKEAAGIERAMGANGFGAGKFAPEIHRRFVGLSSEQKAYFHLFERFSPGDGVAELRTVLAGEAAAKLRELRELAYGEPFGADISGVTGPQWFAAATAYIDALKTVEDVMARDIVDDAHELAAEYERDFWILSASLGLTVLLILVLSVVIARSIAKPVGRLSHVMNRLAEGDTEVRVIDHGLRDEIGEMARAVEVFRDNAIARKALEAEAEQAALHEAELKKETMVKLADDFESVVGSIIVAVSENTRELREASQSMSAMAEETSNQSTAVASASEQMAGNVQTVASATEEMGSSVDEIGRQAQNSSDKANLAADAAQKSVVRVQALSGSVQKIGDIVGLIQAIAEQTNLLALNATIEAARAGEAGKGFAVVAAEVKDLATQTSKATEEISSQIAEIQSETESSVAAIETVTQVIEELNGLATSIAAAVDQQGAATREIAGNVQQAAHGSEQVAENIAGVGHAASQSSAAAVRVLELSNTVAEHTDEMRDKTHGFLERVRAG